MSFFNYMQTMMGPNIQKNDDIYTSLSNRKDVTEGKFEIIEKPLRTYFAFQIRFTNTKWGLSISCPPDVYEHAETALLVFSNHNKEDYKLEYVDDWGYQDVCRFSSNEDLIAEIKRIRECIDHGENLREDVPLPQILVEN